MFDAIFGTPNRDKAMASQRNLMHNQLAKGNQLHNQGTTGKMEQELAIMNYRKRIANDVQRAGIKAQGDINKKSEQLARLGAGAVVEGGRSRTSRKGGGRSNQTLMLLSQLSKAESMGKYVKGERADAARHNALLNYQNDFAKANAKIGVGVGAKQGVTYTKDNNALKFAKLAISVATGDFGGAFGTMDGGGNASLIQAIGGGEKYDPSTGWLTGRG